MSRRLVPIAAALGGWMLLVVVAAGPSAGSRNWLTLPDFSSVITILYLIAVVVGFVVLVQNLRTVRPDADGPPGGRTAIVVGIIIGLAIAFANPDLDALFQPDQEESVDPLALEPAAGDASPADFDITSDHVYLALFTVGALVALLLWNHSHTRNLLTAPTEPPLQSDELASVLQAMAGDLAVGGDHRKAVMVAYARMEQALAGSGLPRLAPETAPEHLARVRSSIPIDAEPLVRLARLYELARFSTRPITENDRRSALADLDALRIGIGAAS